MVLIRDLITQFTCNLQNINSIFRPVMLQVKSIAEFQKSNEMIRIGWVCRSNKEIVEWFDDRSIQFAVIHSTVFDFYIFDINYTLYRHSHPSFDGKICLFKPNYQGLIRKSMDCHGNETFPITSMHDVNMMVNQIIDDIYIPSELDLELLYASDLFFNFTEWEYFFSHVCLKDVV